jgi:precorrin-6B methylase 1
MVAGKSRLALLGGTAARLLSTSAFIKNHGVVVALNMTDTPQEVTLELKSNGFTKTKKLLATGKWGAKGAKVSLEPFGAFIGELTQ